MFACIQADLVLAPLPGEAVHFGALGVACATGRRVRLQAFKRNINQNHWFCNGCIRK